MTARKLSKYDFVGKRRSFALLSITLCIISLLLFFIVKPTWGIDFTGGTEIHLRFQDSIQADELRSAVRGKFAQVNVQQVGDDQANEYLIRIENPKEGTESVQGDIEKKLKTAFGDDFIQESTFKVEVGVRLVIKHTGDDRSLADITNALKDIPNVKVVDVKDSKSFAVELPGQVSALQKQISSEMKSSFEILQTDSVGPKVGAELRQQGLISILATLGLILAYVSLRFNLSFAPGAVLALLHDVLIVIGLFILLGKAAPYLPFPIPSLEFNLPMVGALLTIIGYSLNDTIVIYDRIRENMARYRKTDLESLINTSINETLRRTINTSLTTLGAMSAFLFFGGSVIQTFALAIILGVIVGTYSTIYVASPTILYMQDIQPMLIRIFSPAERKESKGAE
jgi:preprotein translocase subunit SecF